jgi:MCP family monocarboxylic acid transporter-like MFS transporter 10
MSAKPDETTLVEEEKVKPELEKEPTAPIDAEKANMPPTGPPAAMQFPDGGAKAWLTVLGAWCVIFGLSLQLAIFCQLR